MTAATLHHGDCLAVLRTLPDNSIDAVVTDPSYGLAEHKPATIHAAEPTREALNALHRMHRLAWTDAHTAAGRAHLAAAGVSHR